MDSRREIWKSGIAGTISVLKFNRRGELASEVVRSGQACTLTTEERIINQEKAATADLDIFKNGMMVPVRILDDAEDAAEIAANPNLMAESEMNDLFKAHWKTFENRVAQVSNPIVIQRLLQIAEAQDATVKQVNVLKVRMESLREKTAAPRPEGSEAEGDESFRPVTPL